MITENFSILGKKKNIRVPKEADKMQIGKTRITLQAHHSQTAKKLKENLKVDDNSHIIPIRKQQNK